MSSEQALAQANTQPQHAAAPPELVPCLLTLGSSTGMMQDWLLWPVNSSEADLQEFSEGLVRDLGVPLQFRRPVADTIRAQVADWVANVPPLPAGAGPRRELIKLDLVLGGSLRLRDQFWWDLHAASPTPEAFAAELCADCGIDSCHGTAVAAAMRIELGKLRRAPPSNLQLPTPRILEAAAPLPPDVQAFGRPEQQLQHVYDDSCLRMPDEWHKWGPTSHELTPEEAQALQKQQQATQQRKHTALVLAQRIQPQQAGVPLDSTDLAPQPLLPPKPQKREQEPVPTADTDGGGRRQLRARRGRASRLRELLRQEEQEDEKEHSSGSDSARGAAGGAAADRASRSVGRVADGGGGSTASRGYQPGDDSVLRGTLREEEEGEEAEAAEEARHRARSSRARQRRRSSGAGAAKLATAHKQQQQPSQQASQQQQQRQQQGAAHAMPTPQQQSMLPIQLHSNGSGGVSLPPGLHGMGPSASGQLPPLMAGGTLGAAVGGAGLVPGGMPAGAGLAPLVGQQQQASMLLGMVPTPGGPGGTLPPPQPVRSSAGLGQAPTAGVPPSQQAQMVAAALCHYARELSMGEDKIRAMLSRPPADQLALFRTLHQLVQQARARQQEQLEAAMAAAQPPPGGGLSLPPMPVPAHDALPPMPMPMPIAAQQHEVPSLQQQPQSQFANLFSEMFD